MGTALYLADGPHRVASREPDTPQAEPKIPAPRATEPEPSPPRAEPPTLETDPEPAETLETFETAKAPLARDPDSPPLDVSALSLDSLVPLAAPASDSGKADGSELDSDAPSDRPATAAPATAAPATAAPATAAPATAAPATAAPATAAPAETAAPAKQPLGKPLDVNDESQSPSELPQQTDIAEVTSVALLPLDDGQPIPLWDAPVAGLSLAFPFEVPLQLSRSADGWAVRDARKAVDVATVKVGNETTLSWAPTAAQGPQRFGVGSRATYGGQRQHVASETDRQGESVGVATGRRGCQAKLELASSVTSATLPNLHHV